MPYDLKLPIRVSEILEEKGLRYEERKMFGGVCIMVHGNMCCGVDKDRIMARVGPKNNEKALKRRYAVLFDIRKDLSLLNLMESEQNVHLYRGLIFV